MPTTKDTLRFAFGTTPEGVIRLSFAQFDSERELAFAESAFDGTDETSTWLRAVRLIDGFRHNSDALITVLDALYRDAVAATQQPAGVTLSFPGVKLATPPQTAQGQLRISILASLGVMEG